jgi:hypothetical protein
MPYLLDANVFIQAKNLHYGLDFCPAFWDWLIAENAAKRVFSIEKVGDEILAIADELAEWASDRGEEFFLKPDAKLLAALSLVSAWATGKAMSLLRSAPFSWSQITIWWVMHLPTDTPW